MTPYQKKKKKKAASCQAESILKKNNQKNQTKNHTIKREGYENLLDKIIMHFVLTHFVCSYQKL